jgi:tetratricopeptide (TPR) repeat protein
LQEAIDLSADLVTLYPNVPEYTASHARYLDLLGIASFDARDLDQAEKLHRKAVAFETRLVKQYPEVIAYSFWLSLMERSLGQALSDRGELEEARTRLESAATRLEGLRRKDPRLGPVDPILGRVYRDLAQALTRSGEAALAAEALRKAEEFGRDRGPGSFGPRERGDRRP